MERIELLAPAGDLERLKVTLLYGADAVYLGGRKLGLRANATNFTKEELKDGCTFAHNLKKKVYVTLKCFLFFEFSYSYFLGENGYYYLNVGNVYTPVAGSLDEINTFFEWLFNFCTANYLKSENLKDVSEGISDVDGG